MTTTMMISIPMLICFFALMIGVGFYCRKHSTNVDGFVLGGRSVGPWLTAFAFGTSYFSAVIFVGYAGQFGWNFGLASTWIGLGNAFIGSLLAWSVLGTRTRVMTQHLDSKTMPDFFEKRYDSKALKIIAILKDTIWSNSVFIAQMMGVSWGALAGAFLAPFLYGLYWKKTTKSAVVASFIFGTGLEIIQLLISIGLFKLTTPILSFVFANSLYSGVFAMVGGLVLVPIVSLLTQKTLPENIDEKFSCYNKKVTTTVTNSLG